MSGVFINFESIDGVGKTTQVTLLADALTNLGFPVFVTKEPGDTNMGSNVGAGIRELLFKDPTTLKMRPGVADLLFLADHVQTAGDVAQAVSDGRIVVCDRYADSQFAYAASPTKQSPDWALRYYRERYGIEPDLTVLLVARGPEMLKATFDGDLKSGTCTELFEDFSWALGRAKGRKGIEAGKQDGKAWNSFQAQRTIQNAYLSQIGHLSRTVVVSVWENDTIEFVHEHILGIVLRKLRFAPSSALVGIEASTVS